MRQAGDRRTGRLVGVQLPGHPGTEIAKRIEIPATANFNKLTVDAPSDLDLSLHPAAQLTGGRATDRGTNMDSTRAEPAA